MTSNAFVSALALGVLLGCESTPQRSPAATPTGGEPSGLNGSERAPTAGPSDDEPPAGWPADAGSADPTSPPLAPGEQNPLPPTTPPERIQ